MYPEKKKREREKEYKEIAPILIVVFFQWWDYG